MPPVALRNPFSPARRFARFGLRFVLGLAILVALGVTYQSITSRADARRYDPPGELVDIGTAELHLYCTGQGRPTVVLEAGATGFAQSWAWIQQDVSARTRTCSYDRAGLGWSENGTARHDGRSIARNLNALLGRADEPEPYVLVGHSMGGAFVRIFADAYPEQVAGLVLLDPVHEDQLNRYPPEMQAHLRDFARRVRLAPRLARVGVLRATNLISRKADGLPEEAFGTARMFGSSPKHLRTSADELAAWETTMSAARSDTTFEQDPLLVVSAAAPRKDVSDAAIATKLEMHHELSMLSPLGRHVLLKDADHFSLLTDRNDARRVSAHLVRIVEDVRANLPSTRPSARSN